MITIDGIEYDVPFISIERNFETLDKSAERSEDGVLHRELIGTYYNYDVVMGMSAYNVSDYAALYLVVSEPIDFHSVSIPGENNNASWDAYISKGKDKISRMDVGGVNYYRGLSFSIIAKSPARVPA